MKKLDEFIRENAINRYGIELLSKNQILHAISICIENQIDILGIDVFKIEQNITIPLSEYSIDNSYKKISNLDMYNHICSIPHNDEYMYEIVFN